MKPLLLISLLTLIFNVPSRAALPDNARPLTDIDYAGDSHKHHRLDLYLPAPSPIPSPVILWIHGGGWNGGDKSNPPALPFLAKGYAVVSADYRLTQDAIFPAQIHDCKAVVRWIRAHAAEHHLDPDRIGVWGSSAGGHLVALLGLTANNPDLEGSVGPDLKSSSSVTCVVDACGPTDFLTVGPWDTRSKLLGGDAHDIPDQARRASPMTYVSKSAPPFLILHGADDPRVPPAQSQSLHDALRAAGVDSTLLLLPHVRHGGPAFYDKERLPKIESFFDQHLKPKT